MREFRPLLLLFLSALMLRAGEGIEQPLPFSHKLHAGAFKVACKMCHANPNPGERMSIAAASLCMQCHSAIKTESPAIRKLAQFAQEQKPIPWVRIYEIPSYVNFSHRAHLEARSACEDCHGKVVERDQLWKQGDISMGGCMKCHREKKVSIDCTFCHEQR